jgi:hypothetical protein
MPRRKQPIPETPQCSYGKPDGCLCPLCTPECWDLAFIPAQDLEDLDEELEEMRAGRAASFLLSEVIPERKRRRERAKRLLTRLTQKLGLVVFIQYGSLRVESIESIPHHTRPQIVKDIQELRSELEGLIDERDNERHCAQVGRSPDIPPGPQPRLPEAGKEVSPRAAPAPAQQPRNLEPKKAALPALPETESEQTARVVLELLLLAGGEGTLLLSEPRNRQIRKPRSGKRVSGKPVPKAPEQARPDQDPSGDGGAGRSDGASPS